MRNSRLIFFSNKIIHFGKDGLLQGTKIEQLNEPPPDKCRRGYCQRNSLPGSSRCISGNSSPGNLIEAHSAPSLSV